jgi:transporter, basic amino acid/polyamine antiporter (APA) family
VRTIKKRAIGKLELVALIVSSCIGAGIFGITTDISTAAAPGPAILAWLFVGLGILFLVLSLNNLSQKRPDLESGVFSYAHEALGPLAEFIAGWTYWLSDWLGNIAIATMMMSALGTFFPIFGNGQTIAAILFAIVVGWILTYLVNEGVENAAFINTIGTFFKICPLILFLIFVIISFKAGLFTANFWGNAFDNLNGSFKVGNLWSQIRASLLTMIWVFIGIEGASVMAHRAKTRKEAEFASIVAFILLFLVYVLISILPYGVMTQAQLAKAGQPALGAILTKLIGWPGTIIINIGLIVSTFISWLSWTLLPAESTMLLARDKVLPPFWGKTNKKGAPKDSLILTASLQSIFLFSLLFTKQAYEFAYSLCVAASLFTYLFVCIYQMKLSRKENNWGQLLIGLLGALFQLCCMILAGWKQVLLVTVSFIPGFYLYYKARKYYQKTISLSEKLVMIFLLLLSILAIYLVIAGTIKISG